MAPRNKQQETKAAATMRAIYPRDGAIEALRGQSFDVPMSVSDKRGWIESRYREQAAREAAEAEKESRDAAVLRDRQEQVRAAAADQQRRDALTAELEVVRAELADVRQQVANPDERRLLEVNQNTTACMGRVLDAADKVAGLVDRVEELEAKARELAALADADRQVSLDLIKNQIELLNGIQRSNGELINQYAARYQEAAQEAIDLSEQINANWEVVQNATRINETAIAQATAASKKLLMEQHEEFLASLNVALGAMGVTQEDLDRELVRLDTMGADFKSPLVSPEYLAQMVQVTRKHRDARADAERRTNEASARSAGVSAAQAFVPGPAAKRRPGLVKGA